MADMFYPYENELFMSDNCNCEEAAIHPADVVSRPLVVFSPAKLPTTSAFVRQIYVTGDQSFRTLSPSDFTCHCDKTEVDDFARVQKSFGLYDTVLVAVKRRGQVVLEPGIIENFEPSKRTVRVRRLMRAKRDLDCNDARPNELVWTSKFFDVKAKHVVRRCHVRFWFKEWLSQDLPSPYNRNGQADCFTISRQLVDGVKDDSETIVALSIESAFRMNQTTTFDLEDAQKLATLSLFSGGGNFDRGFEEAGALCTKWAVEWNPHAAHTYRANLHDPEKTNIFLGSVDEHLRRALAGELSASVPAIGAVQALLAGSPCQGFSTMQPDKLSVDSVRNASKVATVASYIDLWRPKYAILENVPEMTRQLGHNKSENVFSQLLCCLVAMGYQVQQLLMDAWSYGEAQSRSRLFIVAVAPGLPRLLHPNITHAHPEDMPGKTLGKAPNGQPFGVRHYEPTAFLHVSAKEATKDLPDIGDGNTHACLALPDHRPGKRIWPLEQDLIKLIPKQPRSQGLRNLLDDTGVPEHVAQWIARQSEMRRSEYSKSYIRLDPSKLFRTITTSLNPSDGKAGFGVHWEQDRVLTVMEARRAQGFPDYEVIIGDISAQWKIIGNSVSRAVALALGLCVREAVRAMPSTESKPPAILSTLNHASRRESPFVLIDCTKRTTAEESIERRQSNDIQEEKRSKTDSSTNSDDARRSVTLEADTNWRPTAMGPLNHQFTPAKQESNHGRTHSSLAI
jgi:DNA (cytosine-5)-methyltransferase 1